MEPSLNILFLDKNIIDPDELYMTDIYRLPLTAALSFIGFKVFEQESICFRSVKLFSESKIDRLLSTGTVSCT